MIYQRHRLENGIRIIHKEVKNQVAHCGVIINTGSRDELEREQGIAHFIEHTIFKGTKKRKAYHILSRLENVGGELNAYTTKEETCIYASFLHPYYERSMELFADISQNSVFPQAEIEKEKEVIIDEINSYRDNPAEEIFDEIEDMIFEGHPLGRNILGTKELVRSFTRKNIFRFMKRTFNTDEIVICSVGNIEFAKLLRLAEKYFGQIKPNPRSFQRLKFNSYQPKTQSFEKGMYQAHCIIANQAYSRTDKKRTGLVLLNNVLGGPGLNTRLNMGIREKYGFCYNIESNYTMYSDTGILSIYLGTDFSYLEKTIKLVLRELKKLREQKLGSLQLHRAKQQLIGQIAISQESNVNELLSIGKSILAYDKVDSIESIIDEINAIEAGELLEIANEIFDPKQLSTLIYRGQQT
jgi:predicted Zn-dependent peptidase